MERVYEDCRDECEIEVGNLPKFVRLAMREGFESGQPLEN
jgi:hypothetical protein